MSLQSELKFAIESAKKFNSNCQIYTKKRLSASIKKDFQKIETEDVDLIEEKPNFY